ncbi:MAG: hypothetical protein JXR96_23390 [Deltaproteobacteria bacterium]|nr:hypothetical protein [Deltaproteobacteria bacterium]
MENWEKLLLVFVGGVVLVIVSRIIKRGRLPEEDASIGERATFYGGIALLVASFFILVFGWYALFPSPDQKDKKPELGDFAKEPAAGCSKSDKGMKDFRP